MKIQLVDIHLECGCIQREETSPFNVTGKELIGQKRRCTLHSWKKITETGIPFWMEISKLPVKE